MESKSGKDCEIESMMKMLCVPTTHPTHHSHFLEFIPTLTLGNFQFTTQESHRYALKKEREKKKEEKSLLRL